VLTADLIASELGGTRLRKKTMALSTSFDVVSAFAITFTIPYLLGKPGANLAAKVGFVFMGICIAGVLFCFFFVPELSGRSLEEVDELFEQNPGHGSSRAPLPRVSARASPSSSAAAAQS
jgi:hypothetical protein